MSATRAAVEEGIVPGGGVALMQAVKVLADVKLDNPDEQVGVGILKRALEEPMRRIVENAGADGSVVIENVRREGRDPDKKFIGYDVISGKYVNMIEAGIIDPVKVTRGALQNAASIAGMILTTEALVTDIPEKKDAPSGPPGGGMGGMGGGDF